MLDAVLIKQSENVNWDDVLHRLLHSQTADNSDNSKVILDTCSGASR